jgi:hypothetical protein
MPRTPIRDLMGGNRFSPPAELDSKRANLLIVSAFDGEIP